MIDPTPAATTAGPVVTPGQAVLRWTRRGVWALGSLLMAATSIVALAWLILQWGILPRIDQWRGWIAERATARLGVPVHIDRITTTPDLWAPRLQLQGLRIGPDGPQQAQVRRAEVALTPGSLWPRRLGAWAPRLAALEVDADTLAVRRDAQGRWHAAGWVITPGPEPGHAALDWLLGQGTVRLRVGALHWRDEAACAGCSADTQTWSDIDLALQAGGLRGHSVNLGANPPAAWGDRLQVQARFNSALRGPLGWVRPSDWRHWAGHVELKAARLAWPALAAAWPAALRADPRWGGEAAVQGTLAFDHAAVSQARMRVESARLTLPLATDPAAVLRLDEAAAEARYDDLGASRRVVLSGLRWTPAGAAPARLGDATLAWRVQPGATAPAGGALGVDGLAGLAEASLDLARLDLAALAPLWPALPLPPDWHAALAAAAPSGTVAPLALRWAAGGRPGDAAAAPAWSLQADVQGLALRAAPAAPGASGSVPARWPGVERLDLRLKATQAGGDATVAVRQGAVDWPGLLGTDRIALDALSAQVQWRAATPAGAGQAASPWQVQVRDARVANADAAGRFGLTWRAPAGGATAGPGHLVLDAELERADARAAWRYLPQALPESVRHYVRDAVRSGRSRRVVAHVAGDLAQFPFPDAREGGRFEIRADIEAATLQPVPADAGEPAWPAFTDLSGELVFERAGLQFHRARARLAGVGAGGLAVHDVSGGIRDFGDPTLVVRGHGQGPLQDGLAYVATTPVGGWLEGALDRAHGSGTAAIDLDLALPLDDTARARVKGEVSLAGNDVALGGAAPPLQAARGRIRFTQDTVQLVDAHARVAGLDLALAGGAGPGAALQFEGRGRVDAAWLREHGRAWLPERLLDRVEGSAGVEVALAPAGHGAQVEVRSDLVGLALHLPEPLGKAGDEAVALRLQAGPATGAPAEGTAWTATLGDRARAVGSVGTRTAALQSARVELGAAALSALPAPAAGVLLAARLPSLSLDAWRDVVDLDSPQARVPLPDVSDIEVARLVVAGRALHDVKARVEHHGAAAAAQAWQVDLDAREAQGRVELTGGGGDRGAATPWQVRARLARLTLPAADAAPAAARDRAPPPAGSDAALPRLDIEVERLQVGERALGRLVIDARPDAAPAAGTAAPAWLLQRLSLDLPQARLAATGRHVPMHAAAAARTDLVFRLDVADSGQLLAHFGQGGAVAGGRGHVAGELSWPGAPWAPAAATLSGRMQVMLDAGRIVKADTGAARLLSVLSLQALPRRLALDFSDVVQEGFSFDTLAGDVALDRGNARTRNLRLRGALATVLVDGGADLVHETQDLHVWVVPEIDAGTASLAYALINPVVGLGTLVGQWLLRKPLAEANLRELTITGSWADPTVVALQRPSGRMRPDAAALPPPAADLRNPADSKETRP